LADEANPCLLHAYVLAHDAVPDLALMTQPERNDRYRTVPNSD
jgi:hypothetical protein